MIVKIPKIANSIAFLPVKLYYVILCNTHFKSYSVILCYTKVKTAISVDSEILKWIEQQVKTGRFANVSHGFEYCARTVKERKLSLPTE